MTEIRPFTASAFTATQWDTAEDKARAANALARFVDSGFQWRKYTKRVYHTLYQHLFGHIAHFDKDGFWATWFDGPFLQLDWCCYVLQGGTYRGFFGDPAHTWSDVEKAFQDWLNNESGVPDRLRIECARIIEAQERAELARLKEKYEEA